MNYMNISRKSHESYYTHTVADAFDFKMLKK